MAVKQTDFALHVLYSCCLCGLALAGLPVKMHSGLVEQEVTRGCSSRDKTSCGQLVKCTAWLLGLINPGLFMVFGAQNRLG